MFEYKKLYYIPHLSKSSDVVVYPQEGDHATMKYSCDTAPGQSGGPICTDGSIIGIHNAAGARDGNEGLLITTTIHLWIDSVCSEA